MNKYWEYVQTIALNVRGTLRYQCLRFRELTVYDTTTAPHVGSNTPLQLLLGNSKSKRGHNNVKKIDGYLPYWYGLSFESKQLV